MSLKSSIEEITSRFGEDAGKMIIKVLKEDLALDEDDLIKNCGMNKKDLELFFNGLCVTKRTLTVRSICAILLLHQNEFTPLELATFSDYIRHQRDQYGVHLINRPTDFFSLGTLGEFCQKIALRV